MKKIAVIGAGAMGRQIALQCALKGVQVCLQDIREEGLNEAEEFAHHYLDGRVAKGELSDDESRSALASIELTNDLAYAVSGVALVIEAIVEKIESKLELFRKLDVLCLADTILGTSSATIRASRLAEVTGRPGRVLNIHFFNSALVMELVEIVARPEVPEEVIRPVEVFCRKIGKVPVVLRKEISGFIVNRIFRALTREALSLYEDGYASADDIDLAVMKGLGHPMGPLRLLDNTGIDVSYLARLEEYKETGVESTKPNRILKEMYDRGEWGRKSGKGFYSYDDDNNPH